MPAKRVRFMFILLETIRWDYSLIVISIAVSRQLPKALHP